MNELSHPAAGKGGSENAETRRGFLTRITVLCGGIAGVLAGIPFLGVLFSPARRPEPDVWRSVGSVEDFAIGETVRVTYPDPAPLPWSGASARSAAWLRRDDQETFTAFTIHCTHTGCPVLWVEPAGLFMCHCHGGAFYRDGSVAAGPPPAPLTRQEVRVAAGVVQIRTLGVQVPGESGSADAGGAPAT